MSVKSEIMLRRALAALIDQNVAHTGDFNAPREVAHWLRERALGNGAAQAMLDAYEAMGWTTEKQSAAIAQPEAPHHSKESPNV